MPAEEKGRPHRIEWRLPLTIAAVLVVVVAAFTLAAYREVRTAALEAAEHRLLDVAGQLAGLLSETAEDLLAEAVSTAATPALVEALARPSPAASERARATLDAQLESSAQLRALELWDARGVLVAEARAAGEDAAVASPPVFSRGSPVDSAAVSGFRAAPAGIRYAVTAPVGGADRPLGTVVHHRAVSNSPEGVRQIEGLIGSGAVFKIGVPGGTWTNLVEVVEGPPVGTDGAAAPIEYDALDGHPALGAAVPVRSAPWLTWVEFPLDVVLERPRAFLARVVPFGFVVVLLGAVAGGLLSRRLTGALQASEERFRALASTAPDAIITADHEGRVTYFNRGAERIFGRPASEQLGRPLTSLMPERFHEPHQRGIERWRSPSTDRELDRTIELAGLRADGTEFPIELSLAVRWHGKHPVFTGIIRDITERKRRGEELRRYAAELEATNEELEAFSYSVSHDLRAPLRGIHGFSQAVLEDYQDRLDEQGVDYLQRVCDASERMGILIDDLLELSHATRSEMRMERVDLTRLAHRTAEELAAEDPGRDVDFRIEADLTARGDRKLLALVLGNLMGNAWKFSGGEERAVIEVGSDGGNGTLFVRDNGAGFDMTYADKLFDPFQRLHSMDEFEGTGIGLALVQRIVHRHGGTVWGEGEVGHGATFHFTLPAP